VPDIKIMKKKRLEENLFYHLARADRRKILVPNFFFG
jgi:hypothetical protein